ncbi:hypothetical protein LO749_17185 [Paracoccus denitrificans]|uniref:hypothetical protein n=1 Tax=Paracoccus denitrificans TaxID=266 RepID=UPI001E4B23CC|nr:hypothetical protein LO749_17185 [Paracoccus denitrificans]
MEYILDDNSIEGGFEHEDIRSGHSRKYLQDLSAGVSFRGAPFNTSITLKNFWPEIVETVKGAGRYGRILSADLDIDNIDNVVRLSMHVGILSSSEAKRIALGIARNLQLTSTGVSVDREGIDLIKEWQKVRQNLYKILLWDWAEFSAKAMLTRVMEDAVSLGKLSSDNWIMTDDALIAHLSSELTGEGGRTKEILDRLVRGALYEPVSMLTLPGTTYYSRLSELSSKRNIEAEVSSSIGCPCIFHVIKDKAKTKRSITMTNRENGEDIEIGESSDQTLIAVFSSAALSASMIQRAESQLKGVLLRDYGIVQELTILPDPLDEVTGNLPLEQPSLF